MNINVTIGVTPELAKLLGGLTKAVQEITSTEEQAPTQQSAQNTQPQAVTTQPSQPVPTVQASSTPQQLPQQQSTPQTGAVPTTETTYTMEQLGVAAGPLVDSGKGPELTAWLNQRGAQALSHLDKAYYGEFATYLRSLGAKI
ncbi:hypothetical protein [Halalkalibacterium halodurans]|uniref:hypothetical protein n=1 Tax=Halalkalibacterium halodurans TaxID=86665 RepID=UPI0010FEDE2B|nr:hypothetical protein [Halalkalibacterium halodurans]